jgi:type IV pilus assembly protein PilC
MFNKQYKSNSISFLWKGLDENGRKISGEIQAINIRFAKAQLEDESVLNLKIRRKNNFFSFSHNNKITNKDISLIMRQLATLLASGAPLLQALTVTSKSCEKKALQHLLHDIKNTIKQGNTLSSALQAHEQHFDNTTCQLIAAGEQSGSLEIMLERIATYKEKIEQLKKKVRKALLYPCAVISIAMMVTWVLLIFVVPQFAELFSGFGAQLPLPTQAIIKLADFLKSYWWLLLLLIITPCWSLFFFKRRNQTIKKIFDYIIFKIPIFGKILQKATIARLIRTLATSFSTGVPLLEALQSLTKIANNILFTNALTQIHKSVKEGQTLHHSLQISKLFPHMTIQMVAIGEEAGKLSEMLIKIADFYEEEVDQMVDELSQLLEPLIMVILGIIIGGLVIAMYLPIFKLGMII